MLSGMALTGASAILYGIAKYVQTFDKVEPADEPHSEYVTVRESPVRRRRSASKRPTSRISTRGSSKDSGISSARESAGGKGSSRVRKRSGSGALTKHKEISCVQGDNPEHKEISGSKKVPEVSEFTSTLFVFEGELDISDVDLSDDPTLREEGDFACPG